MLRRILLPTILLVLAYGFWVSPNFKTIAAGIAIFLVCTNVELYARAGMRRMTPIVASFMTTSEFR